MAPVLKVKKVGAFCLTAEVEKSTSSKTGLQFADRQRTTGKKLWADLRFEGIAAATRLGFASSFIVLGGTEDRYKDEAQPIDRSVAFTRLLKEELGATGRIIAQTTGPHSVTSDTTELIRNAVIGLPSNHAVLTSWYHCYRTMDLYRRAGIDIDVFPAEAFLVIEGSHTKEQIAERLCGGEFAERCVDEMHYFVNVLTNTVQSIRK